LQGYKRRIRPATATTEGSRRDEPLVFGVGVGPAPELATSAPELDMAGETAAEPALGVTNMED